MTEPTAPRSEERRSSRRAGIAVTGLGVLSPLGLGVDELWDGLAEGRRAPAAHPPSARGIAVPPEAGLLGDVADRARRLVGARRLRRVSRLSLYCVAAARLALERVGIAGAESTEGGAAPLDRDTTAVVLGTSFGSSEYHFEYYEKLYRGGLREASPLLFSESVMNAASGHVSLYFGLRGPSLARVGGEEVGLEAIADAADRISLREVSAALAGGGEEWCDFVQAALLSRGFIEAPDARGGAPEVGPRFFSEGAGFVLLEEEDEARARGRQVLAKLLGCGIARAAGGGGGPRRETIALAIRDALREARVTPADIDLVVGSTASGDPRCAELLAVRDALGSGREPVVLAPKVLLGEGFAATSTVQAVIAVEALRRRQVPRGLSVATGSAESGGPASSVAPRYALVVSVNRLGASVAIVFGVPGD